MSVTGRRAASSGRGGWLLLLILLAAFALRGVLASHRGQYFWLDESHRFHPCLVIVDALANGSWGEVADIIAASHLHTGFFLVGIPVAAVYVGITGYSSYPTLWIPAVVLSLSSVACIGLVYALARRLGAAAAEALLAALLMACANSMLYYARHLLPYDSALALALLALWLGLAARTSLARSLAIGLVASLAYLTYFGYLITVLVAGAVHVLRGRRLGAVATRAAGIALGFVVVPLALHAFSIARGQTPFLRGVVQIMQLATQGGFAEGWRVVWAYLWYAETGMLVLWAAGALGVVVQAARGAPAARARGLLWLGIAAALYAFLVLNSTVLGKAVVLGRFARQLVPFLCLATACALAEVARRRALGAPFAALLVAAIVLQAAVNFAAPLAQRFPPEVQAEVAARPEGNLAHDLSIEGPEWDRLADRPARYVLLNTVTFLYPAKGVRPIEPGRVLLRYPHPLQFLPYQYEAYDPAGRAVLREADISMRLLDTQAALAP